jgi:outer membrane protein OmpA-like peptidoglycan-associated protein
MKQVYLFCLAVLLLSFGSFAQLDPKNLPKDATINVSITDLKNGNSLNNEIVVFKSHINGTEYQGLSDSTGKFTVHLPAGDKYDYFVLGFKDTVERNEMEIPALKPNQYYDKPFKLDIQFLPPASFVLEGCNFETGKADLQPESYAVLDDLVEYLKRKDDEKIEVAGHTDNVGKAESNLLLSQNRANTVKAYLIMKGISPDRIIATGYGDTMPIADNSTAEGRAINRRTEVRIL